MGVSGVERGIFIPEETVFRTAPAWARSGEVRGMRTVPAVGSVMCELCELSWGGTYMGHLSTWNGAGMAEEGVSGLPRKAGTSGAFSRGTV